MASATAVSQPLHDPPLPAADVRTSADAGASEAARLLAAGHAARLAGRRVDALRDIDAALALKPAFGEALAERILIAEELGAAHEALALAQLHPELIAPDRMLRLQGSDVAQLVRFGPLDPKSPATRFAVTDRAIAALDQQLARLSDRDPAAAAARLRTRFDRLVAWRQRSRMQDVVREYEALSAEQAQIPNYVLAPVGDAYLYLHRPAMAQPLYQRSLRVDPDDFETSIKLFYALTDMGRWDAATRLIDTLNSQQPKWLWLKGAKSPVANPRREITERMAAEARLNSNALQAAQHLFTSLTQAAPANADYQVGLGELYAARGWPRQARDQFEMARTLDPAGRDPGIAASMALNDLTLQRYPEATAAISDLESHFPELGQALRAERELSLYQRPEYSASVLQTSAPATSVNNGNGLLSEISAYSSPIDYHWRIHADASDGYERYAEGDITLRRAMLGIEYRMPGLVLQFDSTGNSYGVVRAGAQLQATWSPNDTWQIDGKGAIFSPDTPLRALLHGVTADSADLDWTYRSSELFKITFGVGVMDFSDGNLASGLKSNLTQRVYTDSSLTVDALVDLAATRNTMPRQAYYSPAADFQSLLGIDIGQVFARRYERYFKNSLTLQAGSYVEQDYGARSVARVGDKLGFHVNDALEISLGLTFGRPVYDGVRENEFSSAFSAIWRI
jgi:biofilm PGA synthesis protein PgaA